MTCSYLKKIITKHFYILKFYQQTSGRGVVGFYSLFCVEDEKCSQRHWHKYSCARVYIFLCVFMVLLGGILLVPLLP